MVGALIRLARPHDWVKNVFVLIPVPFALAATTQPGASGAELDVAAFLLGLAGFCLINSAVYTLNDVCDAEADRQHPRKRHRPVAAGMVPPAVALVQSLLLVIAGGVLCLSSGKPGVMPLVATYLAISVAYSLGAKHFPLLDVFLLCSGFVIRVILGCMLVGVVPSPWLLLCSSALAMFLGFTKRRADLTTDPENAHRPSGRGYTRVFLDQAMAISAGVALLCYAIYAIESPVFLPNRQLASLLFVAYGILDYLRMAQLDDACGSPVQVAYTSRSMQFCAVGWLAAVFWSLGLW
jgi:decaprenyl-phosphate phosphoribosyltransferase